LGLKLLPLEDCDSLDVAIDGADAVDSQGCLLKGFGAALTREKIVASMAKEFWILVDERKRKINLPLDRLPCEILPCAYAFILLEIKKKGMSAVLRMQEKEKSPLITDNGGWILDMDASQSSMDLPSLDLWLHSLPGLLETGLFLGFNIRLFDGSMKNQFLV
jgi:ribose 5-phosphate isomerase A